MESTRRTKIASYFKFKPVSHDSEFFSFFLLYVFTYDRSASRRYSHTRNTSIADVIKLKLWKNSARSPISNLYRASLCADRTPSSHQHTYRTKAIPKRGEYSIRIKTQIIHHEEKRSNGMLFYRR